MAYAITTTMFTVALLGSAAITAGGGDSEPPCSPSTTQPAFPKRVELALGTSESVKTDPPFCGDEFRLVVAPDQTRWLFFPPPSHQGIHFAVRRNGTWSEPKPIPTTSAWEFCEQIVAELDTTFQPVIAWVGHDNTPGSAVAAVRWTGTEWTQPEVLHRQNSGTAYRICSLRDTQGNVHIAFDNPLKPQESYSHGFLIMVEGFFPTKCWHAIFDGTQWSGPKPTKGRCKISFMPLGLSPGPDGTVVMAMHVRPMGKQAYVGSQVWDGEEWGRVERHKDGASGGLVASPWGDMLVWWDEDAQFGCSLVRGDREAPVAWADWGSPVPFASDRSGRMVAYLKYVQDGKLCVWSGRDWATLANCGLVERIVANPNGNLLLARWYDSKIHIQEIIITELPEAKTTSQPNKDIFVNPKTSRLPTIREALLKRDLKQIRKLLENHPGLAGAQDEHGEKPLMLATERGYADVVRLLLEFKADIRGDAMNVTPLHIAAKNNNIEIAKLLLDHGAKINEEDHYQHQTALAYAESAKHEEMIALLKSRGGTPQDYERRLVRAVRDGDQQRVRELLKRGLSVNTTVPNGQCLLDYAAETGDIEMAKLLIAKGASVRRANKHGRTALYWASGEAKPDMITFLINEGADPNARDYEGETPLHQAVDWSQRHEAESLETMKRLIAGGANVNAKTSKGVTPLAHAKIYGTDAIRDYLRTVGGTE